jgi:hypothetical protein
MTWTQERHEAAWAYCEAATPEPWAGVGKGKPELFSAYQDSICRQLDGLVKGVSALENFKSNIEGRFWALGAGFTLLNLVIGIVFKLI